MAGKSPPDPMALARAHGKTASRLRSALEQIAWYQMDVDSARSIARAALRPGVGDTAVSVFQSSESVINLVPEIIPQVRQYLLAKKAYYAGTPIMTDVAFDALEAQIRAAAPTHPCLSIVGTGDFT